MVVLMRIYKFIGQYKLLNFKKKLYTFQCTIISMMMLLNLKTLNANAKYFDFLFSGKKNR